LVNFNLPVAGEALALVGHREPASPLCFSWLRFFDPLRPHPAGSVNIARRSHLNYAQIVVSQEPVT
jgi:hypothetical protein